MSERGAFALRRIKEQMEANLAKLARLEKAQLVASDLEQAEAVMMQLSAIQRDCAEASRTVQEENLAVQRLQLMSGGLGWKVSVADCFQDKQALINRLKTRHKALLKQLQGQ